MKVGKFSLELIHAETKEPLKEFTAPDGKVYVEAEPDLEYFIRCHRDRGRERRKKNDTTVTLDVDGTNLGYDQSFYTTAEGLGLAKRKNGVDTNRSLKLILKKRTRGASNTVPFYGSVKATFFETIFTNEMVELIDFDETNCLNQSSASTPAVATGAKKLFASVSGSATVSGNVLAKREKRRNRGRRLGERTIYYTSALGLSQLGILPSVDAVDATNGDAPATTNNSSSTTTRINTCDDDDVPALCASPSVRRNHTNDGGDDVVIIEQPECKRARTKSNLIDLTGGN